MTRIQVIREIALSILTHEQWLGSEAKAMELAEKIAVNITPALTEEARTAYMSATLHGVSKA